MLKLNYFLADIFILSAEKQPIKLSWRKIEWLLVCVRAVLYVTAANALLKEYDGLDLGFELEKQE